jgi:hypothetical protein
MHSIGPMVYHRSAETGRWQLMPALLSLRGSEVEIRSACFDAAKCRLVTEL